MHYESLRKRAWSHRAVVAMAAIVVVAATAIAATPAKNEELYKLDYTYQTEANRVVFDLNVIEIATGQSMEAKVSALYGEWATMTGEHNGREINVKIRKKEGSPVEAILTVAGNGNVLQMDVYKREPKNIPYSGDKIDLNLKDADFRDVMQTFSDITGLDIAVAPDIDAKVSIHVTDMPWDEAMMKVAEMTGTKITIEGKTIRVTK